MLRLTPVQMNFLCVLTALALFALPAFAQTTPSDQIQLLLKQKGYTVILQERTWLGRGRLVAIKDGMQREVVFNPGTGEILRDYAARVTDAGADGTGAVATAAADATPTPAASPAPNVGVSLSMDPDGPLGISSAPVGVGQ